MNDHQILVLGLMVAAFIAFFVIVAITFLLTAYNIIFS